MAIRFRVAELAREKGLTGYALTKKLGSSRAELGYRLLKVDSRDSISKDNIERICIALDCEPKDFIVRVPDEQPAAKKTAAKKVSSKKKK